MKDYIEFYARINEDEDFVEQILIAKDKIVSFEIAKIEFYSFTNWNIHLKTLSNDAYTIAKNSRGSYFKTKKEARAFIDSLMSNNI